MTTASQTFYRELVNQVATLPQYGTASIVSEIGTFVEIEKMGDNECWIGDRRLLFATIGQIVDAILIALGYRLHP